MNQNLTPDYAVASPLLDEEQFRSIVNAGIWAPSADNEHAIWFDRLDDSIRIWPREQFLRAPFHRRILGLLSLGAVVENMTLQAHEFGLKCDTRWFDSSGCLATLALLPATKGASDLARAIYARQTNRRFFHGPKLTEAERAQVTNEAHVRAKAELIWLDAPKQRRDYLELVRVAEVARFACAPLHHELFAAIRFDVDWQTPADRGLAPGSLEIERGLRLPFKILRHRELMRALKLVGAHHLLGVRAGDLPCRLAPHVGVIATRTTLNQQNAALEAGRALQRVWLRLTQLGFAVQPFAACTLFALEEYQDVPLKTRNVLASGWAKLLPGMRPLISFRAGHARAPSVRNTRQPLENYLRSDDVMSRKLT